MHTHAHLDVLADAHTHKNVQLRALTACLKATFQWEGMFCSSWAEIWPLSADRSVPVGFKSVLFWSWWSAFSLYFSLFLSLSQSLYLWVGGCCEPGWYCQSDNLVCRSLFPHSLPGLISPLTFPRQPVSSSQLPSYSQHSTTLLHTIAFRQLTALSEQLCLLSVSQWLYFPPPRFLSYVFHGCHVHMLRSLEEEECFTVPQLLNLFSSFIRESACWSGQMALSVCDCG